MEKNLNIEREFEWNDTIEHDSDEFIILPAGDYDFEITNFERARHGEGKATTLQ